MPHVNPSDTLGLRRLPLEHIKYIHDLNDITLKYGMLSTRGTIDMQF